ncbi:MAG: hypothetical protein NC182_01835 [Prevotella sp.]|nr:hypothetical protein [Staphylococcus sp.]MCM1349924.1 hypothetical protein [Prevotella sp.]
MLKEANLKSINGIVVKIDNTFYIVYDEKLSDGEKEKLINCLQTHIKLNRFDFKLIGNEIIESEVIK